MRCFPERFHGRFDVIFEGGTLQQVYHIPSQLRNVHAMLRSTGRSIHGMDMANNHVDLNTLGMVANRAALVEGDDWLDQVVAYIDGNHDFAASFVQERIPLKMGGMKGPRSFETAGEIADGLHHALSYSRGAYDYVVDHVKVGAERAGRDG